MSADDTMRGVDRRDKGLKNRLMDQFVNTDSRSRPCTAEYAEGWDRIFGKGQERSDNVNDVTPGECPPTEGCIACRLGRLHDECDAG